MEYASLPPQESHKEQRIGQAVGRAVVAGTLAFLPGAAIGTVAGVQRPTSVEVMPGIVAEASVDFNGNGTNIAWGTIRMHLPEATLPLGVSPTIALTKLDPNLSEGIEPYTIIATEPKASIVQPVESALKRAAITGGILGGIATTALWRARAVSGRRYRQRLEAYTQNTALHTQRVQNEADTSELNFTSPDSALRAQHNHELLRPRRPLLLASPKKIAAAALGGCLLFTGVTEANPRPPAHEHHNNVATLDPSITNRIPLLESARIYGLGGELFNTGAREVLRYTDNARNVWRLAATNLETEMEHLERSGGMDHLSNPDIVPLLHVSDIHCNNAYVGEFLRPLITKLKPKIIINTGDTYTNADTMPFESVCIPNLLEQVRLAGTILGINLTMVNVQGNHDPVAATEAMQLTAQRENGEEYPLMVTLDEENNYNFTLEGITFVGAPDPIRTANGNDPARLEEQEQLIAKQGNLVAQAAATMHEQTGTAPIILTHRVAAAYETLANGDASLALSGHIHSPTPMQAFEGVDGSVGFSQTLGSSTGAAGGITFFSPPGVDAVASLQLFSLSENKPLSTLTVAADRTGNVQITRTPTPIDVEAQPIIEHESASGFFARNMVRIHAEESSTAAPRSVRVAESANG